MNLPNKLTILRLFLVPVFVACFYIDVAYKNHIAAAVFILAYITDILDGRIARKTGCVSTFGKLMDPIADKVLTSSALIMMTAFGMIPPVATLIIISREFVISGFRLIAVEKNVVIAANNWGKIKTVSQCVAISLILLGNPFFRDTSVRFDLVMLWVSVALAVYSAFDYIYKNRRVISAQNIQE